MSESSLRKAVAKASNDLMRAKEEEKERGVPVPQKLRDKLKEANAAYLEFEKSQ
jgi:hypothetical protein